MSASTDPAAEEPQVAASPADLKHTPFYDFHVAAGARMVNFAGWAMPLVYTSILEEHKQCRESGGFFDVSHMGRLRFRGPNAESFLQAAVTRDVGKVQGGQSRYGFVCNEGGGVMDDVIVARQDGFWSMVCNASNRAKLLAYFERVIAERQMNVEVEDRTEETAMAALQGPKVMGEIADLLSEATGADVRTLKRFGFARGEYMGADVEVYRSGYTGEDGVELVLPASMAGLMVGMIGEKWRRPGSVIKPCGLGARDTLRIEAGLPLYGHELSEDVNVLASGMGWAVSTDTDFIGSEAVREADEAGGPERVLIGLELDGRRTARQGTPVLLNDLQVGEVTSGTFSPTLNKSVAMAYVTADYAGVGVDLGVDFKKEIAQARVVPLPFYKRPA